MNRFHFISFTMSRLTIFLLLLYTSTGHALMHQKPLQYSKGYSHLQNLMGGFYAEDRLRKVEDVSVRVNSVLSKIDMGSIDKTIHFSNRNNMTIDCLISDNLEIVYNVLRFIREASKAAVEEPLIRNANDVMRSFQGGLKGKARTVLRRQLGENNVTAILSAVIGGRPEDLLTFLTNNNISTLNLSPMKLITELGVSKFCAIDLQLMMTGVAKRSGWALEMMDASWKPRSGYLDGNTFWPGSYDQCLDIDMSEMPSFSTRHCVVFTPLPVKSRYRTFFGLGTCVPDTCNEEDILIITNAVFAQISDANTTVVATSSHCSNTEIVIDTKAICTLCIIGLVGSIVLLGTILDIFLARPENSAVCQPIINEVINTDAMKNSDELDEKSIQHISETSYNNRSIDQRCQPLIHVSPRRGRLETLMEILLSFSVWSNGRKILRARQTGSLVAINGIRFFSITWVILGHTYTFSLYYVQNLLSVYKQVTTRWTFMVVANAFLSVDTFFTMSGVLVSYVFFNVMEKRKGKMNWLVFYFHRFWRLTPTYLFVMMIHVNLFRYFGDGPLWNKDGLEDNYCRDTWWYNVLFINNFLSRDKICMFWSWYIPNEIQFYIICPLMLLPLYHKEKLPRDIKFVRQRMERDSEKKAEFDFLASIAHIYCWKKLGVLVCLAFLAAATITTTVVSYVYFLPFSDFDDPGNKDRGDRFFEMYYIRPYSRIGPYIIGIMTGYFLHKNGTNVKINKYLNILLWVIATGVACLCLYGVYGPISGKPISILATAFYNATSRTLWGACVCWVIFACATGNGGIVNTLLSWEPFTPLSRLTYCVYLVHPIIINMFYMNLREFGYGSDLHAIYQFLGNLVVSYGVAFIVSLAIESPVLRIEKLLLQQR